MLLCLPFLQLLSLATLFIMLFLLLKTLFAKYHPLHLQSCSQIQSTPFTCKIVLQYDI